MNSDLMRQIDLRRRPAALWALVCAAVVALGLALVRSASPPRPGPLATQDVDPAAEGVPEEPMKLFIPDSTFPDEGKRPE